MGKRYQVWCIVAFLLLVLPLATGQEKIVYISKMDTEFIGQPTVDQFKRDLQRAYDDEAYAIILMIDTPGGLFSAMNDVIELIFSSEIPIITFVAPKGADAASAGTFVTMAGHIAAMAPGTSIGAAQPISYNPTGENVPVTNKTQNYIETKVRSYAQWTGRPENTSLEFIEKNLVLTPSEAVEEGVVDLVADDVDDLIAQIVDLPIHGELPDGRTTVDLTGSKTIELDKTIQDRFTNFMSNPALAYMLFIVGIYGIVFGFSNPGVEVPEVIGAICLILALYGMGIVGANYVGIILICMGVIFFVAEASTPEFGLFVTAGIVCLVLGAFFLPPVGLPGIPRFYMPRRWFLTFRGTVIVLVVGLGGFFALALRSSIRTRRKKPTTGGEGLIGKTGTTMTDLDPQGQVMIGGEIWKAFVSSGALEKGSPVRVIGRKGLLLQVEGD
ncbi:MAG: nodulation protein NfeD [Theionarchaea archaeon]|nr:nodulation protein NfeD [Theionarchaea archaeon]